MRRLIPHLASLVLFAYSGVCAESLAAKSLVLKSGDFWVMAGDSITAQRLHTNFIEAYYRTRFPALEVKFRNSGIGGNTTGSVLARFDYDIADWKPSIVSVELGMNDVGAGDDPVKYIDGMRQLVKRIQAIPATPVLISSSPVNDGSVMDCWQSERCRKIHPYTEALVKFGQEEGVFVVDQFHPLLSRWADNKIRTEVGRLVNYGPALTAIGLKESEPGVKDLQSLIRSWRGSGTARELGGDPVHPGPVGQLTMAATILTKLGAEREVSGATLTADGKVSAATSCSISEVKTGDGELSFIRLDQASPWPIPATAREALVIMPEIAELSRYQLAVTGLPAGNYQIAMNGTVVTKVSAEQLAGGVNLGAAEAGPFAVSSAEIYGLIGNLQTQLNNQWREASKKKDAAKLDAVNKEIEQLEAAITKACQPKPIGFKIERIR